MTYSSHYPGGGASFVNTQQSAASTTSGGISTMKYLKKPSTASSKNRNVASATNKSQNHREASSNSDKLNSSSLLKLKSRNRCNENLSAAAMASGINPAIVSNATPSHHQGANGNTTNNPSIVDSSTRMTYKGIENLNRTVKPKGSTKGQDIISMAQVNQYGSCMPLNERDSWKSATNTNVL